MMAIQISLTKTNTNWSYVLAEQVIVQRLLNSYLREVDVGDPRVEIPRECQQGFPFILVLEKTQLRIFGYFAYWSIMGFHSYSDRFYLLEDGDKKILTNEEVIACILNEFSYLEQEREERKKKRDLLRSNILNSISKTREYIDNFVSKSSDKIPTLDFLLSEQSLYFGHPFHPTPKSSEGFTRSDLPKYAPELQAKFIPCFWAIAPELVQEAWIVNNSGQPESWLTKQVQLEASRKLKSSQQHYQLLPCHPWQTEYLTQLEVIQQLQQADKLVNLGQLGSHVFPTSSVRTVWQPDRNYFYKLPLQVRITNFIRVNPPEQLQRAIDAGKILIHLGNKINQANFQVLLEFGYRSLSLETISQISPTENQEIIANSAVLFREIPEELKTNPESLFVIASLLEPFPVNDEAKLFQAIRQTNQDQVIDLVTWLNQYLAISLKPILELFVQTGISLEAHVQNSLVLLKNGLPHKLYVRDLEGISISKERALDLGWLNQIISDTSPVLYSESEAWERLQYYFLVNHLGHLIAVLGRNSEEDESFYWQIVRDFLIQEQAKSSLVKPREFIQCLLTKETLPAKANLSSRFLERSERPLYIQIINPIHFCSQKR